MGRHATPRFRPFLDTVTDPGQRPGSDTAFYRSEPTFIFGYKVVREVKAYAVYDSKTDRVYLVTAPIGGVGSEPLLDGGGVRMVTETVKQHREKL